MKQYPPEITTAIEYALTVPDPAIQRAIMISNPKALIVMRRIRMAKDRFRRDNPKVDRILRFWSS